MIYYLFFRMFRPYVHQSQGPIVFPKFDPPACRWSGWIGIVGSSDVSPEMQYSLSLPLVYRRRASTQHTPDQPDATCNQEYTVQLVLVSTRRLRSLISFPLSTGISSRHCWASSCMHAYTKKSTLLSLFADDDSSFLQTAGLVGIQTLDHTHQRPIP